MTTNLKVVALHSALGYFADHNAQNAVAPTPAEVLGVAAAFAKFIEGGEAANDAPPAAKEPAKPKTETPKAKPAAKDPAPPAANDAKPLDYERDVKAPMMALAGAKGRDAVAPLFAAFKVQNAKGLTAEQWPAFIAEVARVMADDSVPTIVPAAA